MKGCDSTYPPMVRSASMGSDPFAKKPAPDLIRGVTRFLAWAKPKRLRFGVAWSNDNWSISKSQSGFSHEGPL